MSEAIHIAPENIEIEPGTRISDLTDIASCERAVYRLECEISSIAAQIGRAEENPGASAPGWRTRAQNAQRWKKRAIKAINVKMRAMASTPRPTGDGMRQAMLDVIREDIGEERLQAYAEVAKQRLASVDNGNNGEN